MNIDYVAVNDINGLAELVNHNSAEFVKHIDILTRRVNTLAKSNKRLALAGMFLAGALYLSNARIKGLELKVKNLETVNNYMKGEARAEEDSLK